MGETLVFRRVYVSESEGRKGGKDRNARWRCRRRIIRTRMEQRKKQARVVRRIVTVDDGGGDKEKKEK